MYILVKIDANDEVEEDEAEEDAKEGNELYNETMREQLLVDDNEDFEDQL